MMTRLRQRVWLPRLLTTCPMSMRLWFTPWIAALAIVASAGPRSSASQLSVTPLSPAVATELFELYERGDYASFDRASSTFAGTVTSWVEFEERATSWVAQASPPERRRLVAASVALELAHAERHAADLTLMLIEAGCVLLARQRPTPVERWWHLAAMSLAQSMGRHDFLTQPNETLAGDSTQAQSLRRARERARSGRLETPTDIAHIHHSIARFPDEPAFPLAIAVALEGFNRSAERGTVLEQGTLGDVAQWMDTATAESLIRSNRRDIRRIPPNVRMEAAVAAALLQQEPGLRAAETSRALWILADRFVALSTHTSIAQEANVRLGSVYLRLARSDLALQAFRRAEQAGANAYYTYLARFLAGVSLRDRGLRAEAVVSLRGALAVAPRAQSATFALAPLLFAADAATEAVALTERALQPPVAPDPWKSYLGGDPLRWPTYISQLRQALR